MIKVADLRIQVLSVITVGTGGSFLFIRSVAGVIALGIAKELNFNNYFKIVFVPSLLGYIVAMFVWYAHNIY